MLVPPLDARRATDPRVWCDDPSDLYQAARGP